MAHHPRMPAIPPRGVENAWLDSHTTREHAVLLLVPYPAEEMRMHEISPRVNRATDDTPDLIKAVQTEYFLESRNLLERCGSC